MKKYLYGVLFIFICLLTACKKEFAKGTPSCIKNEIRSRSADQLISRVDEYLFQGKLVYAFEPDERIADGSTTIIDDNCSTMCHIGGFGGPSVNMCNGENFYQHAVLQRNIWTK